ncbi:hypothetical protein CKAH01_03566 [Colletotrichum kahawae]|uniref:Uncharacterized protein n=1 Tax=Colletotrichum kahawae TaxID=34407 RepID=A0AAE0DAT5_COLKA|nr:hypothetical protein CKAH01_03566 [Colletotrichum kahawae]
MPRHVHTPFTIRKRTHKLESTRAGSCDVERHNASRGADGDTREQPAGFGSMGIV